MHKEDLVSLALLFIFLVCEVVVFLFWVGVAIAVAVLAYQLGFEMGGGGLTWGDILNGVRDG